LPESQNALAFPPAYRVVEDAPSVVRLQIRPIRPIEVLRLLDHLGNLGCRNVIGEREREREREGEREKILH
jgi:hypothetical protein